MSYLMKTFSDGELLRSFFIFIILNPCIVLLKNVTEGYLTFVAHLHRLKKLYTYVYVNIEWLKICFLGF